jgi:hypothetical protein
MNLRSLPKVTVIILLIFAISMAQLQEASAKPIFRYVEFNDERKWPGQTHIVEHGIMLKVVAALKEPHKQSMKADLILVDENDDAWIGRMTRTSTEGIREWHEYDLDTSNFNPGPYRLRITAWNSARDGVESEEVTWGDLYLSLEIKTTQTTQPPVLPGFPWEGIILGLAGAFLIIIRNRRNIITPIK